MRVIVLRKQIEGDNVSAERLTNEVAKRVREWIEENPTVTAFLQALRSVGIDIAPDDVIDRLKASGLKPLLTVARLLGMDVSDIEGKAQQAIETGRALEEEIGGARRLSLRKQRPPRKFTLSPADCVNKLGSSVASLRRLLGWYADWSLVEGLSPELKNEIREKLGEARQALDTLELAVNQTGVLGDIPTRERGEGKEIEEV